ncbi:hypothetical protein [Mycoplasma parvum]|uniref:Uncharacterized protein n=1 Tax=Mycoplasma parvum str. Indiana TaxID=1403316 RepID=U5NC82_9MOLU|nr:hypothetical protein [Mycoplasma parvum]AGX89027.1 hypothetical protein PRV_01330 [Mycoplasma parvum str. Indiana]
MKKIINNKSSEHVRGKNHFFSLKIAEKSMYQSLTFCYKKYFYKANSAFQKYHERILAVSLFLLTTSSFLYKKEEEKKCTFHWRNYIRTFSKCDIIDFLYCSIIYLLEHEELEKEDKKLIEEYLPDNLPTFGDAYWFLVLKKNKNQNDLHLLGISLDKYLVLISLAIKLSEIIRYEISKNYSKVLDLIEISDIWKEKMREIFGVKSEYIAFLYFVNLRRKNKKCFQNCLIKFFCWFSFILWR